MDIQDCNICLQPTNTTDIITLHPSSDHSMCLVCYDQWKNQGYSTCPFCRQTMHTRTEIVKQLTARIPYVHPTSNLMFTCDVCLDTQHLRSRAIFHNFAHRTQFVCIPCFQQNQQYRKECIFCNGPHWDPTDEDYVESLLDDF